MARIVFDLDGTLVDSAPDIHAIANAVLADEGRAPITLGQAKSFIGNGAPVFVQRLREARGIPEAEHPRLLAAFVARYEGAVSLTAPYPGVAAALAALAACGHALGLCTNKPLGPARAVLAHFGLDRHLAAVVGGDSLPVTKPDPAPLDAAFAALGEGARLYVGDSEVDAETAHRAKVPFVLFTEGYRKSPVAEMPHVAAFADFAALPGVLDGLLRAS
jgi:phosphoglycolate phosphatase